MSSKTTFKPFVIINEFHRVERVVRSQNLRYVRRVMRSVKPDECESGTFLFEGDQPCYIVEGWQDGELSLEFV
tara:strand:- start:29339 stop:29557 length:219 start_codon:yes stop_codon:yes gene_type:complete